MPQLELQTKHGTGNIKTTTLLHLRHLCALNTTSYTTTILQLSSISRPTLPNLSAHDSTAKAFSPTTRPPSSSTLMTKYSARVLP